MVFCGFLLSLSMMFPRFIYVVAGVSTSFLFMAEEYSIIWIDPVCLIYSSWDGHLSCFYFGATEIMLHI